MRSPLVPPGPITTSPLIGSIVKRPYLQMDPAITKNLFSCGVMNRYINIVIISIRAAYEGGVSGNGLSGDVWPKVL
jgi:hypothetical protein